MPLLIHKGESEKIMYGLFRALNLLYSICPPICIKTDKNIYL